MKHDWKNEKKQLRKIRVLEREYFQACLKNNFGPSAECTARWEEIKGLRELVDAARKEKQ